ncbi:MAG: hypothetical protein JWM53_5940, partial [bacterium]|nr:hypothetical protein [bacterium]
MRRVRALLGMIEKQKPAEKEAAA